LTERAMGLGRLILRFLKRGAFIAGCGADYVCGGAYGRFCIGARRTVVGDSACAGRERERSRGRRSGVSGVGEKNANSRLWARWGWDVRRDGREAVDVLLKRVYVRGRGCRRDEQQQQQGAVLKSAAEQGDGRE
jgi:hypothetical protein